MSPAKRAESAPEEEPSSTPDKKSVKSVSTRLTPMLRHYLEVKEQHPDAILLYRMGDFYELFFDDAVEAAPVLEVALTARQKGTPSEAPMCGVPHHSIEGYIGKLLEAGYRVAVCDQVEDPAEAKGLVRREVTRVVTPGTISELELLDGKRENLLAALAWTDEGEGGIAYLDLSTGRFTAHRLADRDSAIEQLRIRKPREVLFAADSLGDEMENLMRREGICATTRDPSQLDSANVARARLERQFEVSSLRGFGLAEDDALLLASAWALSYASESAMRELSHIRSLEVQQAEDFVTLDETTLRNLEIFENQRGGGAGTTLLGVCDRTGTSGGGRMLTDWLRYPLKGVEEIEFRQEAVAELVGDSSLRSRLTLGLSEIGDLERLTTRAVLGRLSPREASVLRDSLTSVPDLLSTLDRCSTEILTDVRSADPLTTLAQELERSLVEAPPSTLKDGGVISTGIHQRLDECRSLASNAKQHLMELELREKDKTGISNLKVRYNRVFGYYIEVTKSNQARVPERYVRKQTLANAERYFTDELKELEENILGAEAEQYELEEELFAQLRDRIASDALGLRELAHCLATLDVLLSLAEVAARGGYTRPRIERPGGAIHIREGRHPVVEKLVAGEFVPNDTELDPEGAQIVLLTGPNMGGKSTYLRQVAHIVLLAQIGSFVPASEARISLVDRIFTRVGASDDLARGESTFMVEMIETANILRYATEQSLVILDEVGRGTATFDGLSLAWAIVEYLHSERTPKTLFATHYHELTELSALLPRVVNRTMTVKEWREQIVFLHRVSEGAADKSYGIQVARLAGLPETVLKRATEILNNLEEQEYDFTGRPRLARGDSAPPAAGPDQLGLFAKQDEVILQLLREVDLDRLSPLAALNFLSTLKQRLDG